MKQFEWTNSLIASLNHLRIGDTIFVGSGIIECCSRESGCSGCALAGSGRCKDVECFKPIRVYKFIPNNGNVVADGVGFDDIFIDEAKDIPTTICNKEPDIIDKMNISYKRERFAFLSMTFTIGALGAIIMLTIIDLIRYAITFGVK